MANLERWRGEVSAHLEDIGRRLEDQGKAMEALGTRFETALKAHVGEDQESFEAHDERIATLEKAHWLTNGKLAILALVGSAVMAALFTAAAHRVFGVYGV